MFRSLFMLGMCLCLASASLAVPETTQGFYLKSFYTDQAQVILTFDDGPHPQYTPQILDILKTHQVKAIFYLVANQAIHYPALVKRLVREGHVVGNHSYAHSNYQLLSHGKKQQDILKSQAIFKHLTGTYPDTFRPPYGRLNAADVDMLSNYFMHVLHWRIDPRDWEATTTPAQIRDRVLSEIRPGDIILFHDNNPRTVQALPGVLRRMKQRGFRFITQIP